MSASDLKKRLDRLERVVPQPIPSPKPRQLDDVVGWKVAMQVVSILHRAGGLVDTVRSEEDQSETADPGIEVVAQGGPDVPRGLVEESDPVVGGPRAGSWSVARRQDAQVDGGVIRANGFL
jgi:hypothetical protein